MRKELAIALFKGQYILGILFAVAGCGFALVIYCQFQVAGGPMAGSSEPLNAAACAAFISGLALAFGGAASYVAKRQLRKFDDRASREIDP